jgi:hypothetical protein
MHEEKEREKVETKRKKKKVECFIKSGVSDDELVV